jgi:hypothetical protein
MINILMKIYQVLWDHGRESSCGSQRGFMQHEASALKIVMRLLDRN